MKKNIAIILTILSLVIIPLTTFAQSSNCPVQALAGQKYTLACLASIITQYLQVGIYLIISLAVVTFVWNIYRYFFTEKDKKEAGMYVLYSTIGFFVILSLWGLVAILRNSLNLPDNQPPNFPFSNSRSSTEVFPTTKTQ